MQWALLASAVNGSPAPAAGESPSALLESLIAAERGFAAHSVEKGIKTAFLAHMAPDAILFRPGPVGGVKYFQDQTEPDPGTLEWMPDLAAIASTGDMGYTSGPWQYTNGKDLAHGHFSTVWRRQAGGTWKFAIDQGASHAAVDLEVSPVVPEWSDPREREEQSTHQQKLGRIGSQEELLDADRTLCRSIAESGWAKALAGAADAEMRVCRPATLPADGADAALKVLTARPGKTVLTPAGAGVSQGDLGFTYGTGEFHPAGTAADATEYFGYLRVWRALADGTRVVVLDATNRMPAPR